MAITRRQFIKRGAGAATVSVLLPRFAFAGARAPRPAAGPDRKIFIVVQLFGGNDGLNTVIPYTDSNYHGMRPTLSFKDSELIDQTGKTTIISDRFGLHPALAQIKSLYDAGKVALTLGVGYPNPSLSHFLSMDVWHTANLTGVGAEGWLGKYADLALVGKMGLSAASVGGVQPKTLFSNDVVIPNILSFDTYDFLTDPYHPGDSANQLTAFRATGGRTLPLDTYNGAINKIGLEAVDGALLVKSAVGGYSSTITYPANNPLAAAMKMLAEIITTIPEANLLYVAMGSFDHHSDQISHQNGQPNKLAGQHAQLLGWFSDAVQAFYDDMTAHSLADNVVIMQWSEFGRRVNENTSYGTDHGTAAPLFVIGNPVRGGLYGTQPSLAPVDLDSAGNMKFSLDFRSVYATILDKWLAVDSRTVLGDSFENVGFLG